MRVKIAIPLALLAVVAGLLLGCPPAAVTPEPKAPTIAPGAIAAEARWRVFASRREGVYVRLDLPVVMAGMSLGIGDVVRLHESTETSQSRRCLN